MANEILKQLKTKIALKQNTYSYWTEGAGKDYIPLYGEVCFCEIATKDQGAQNAPTVLFKVGTAKLNEDGSYVEGTAKKFAELKWASALAADVYDWAKLSGGNVFAKEGTGNVVSGIEYDATMNDGKGGFKYTTASVATSEGLSDLQKTVAAIEKEIDDKEASWALDTDTKYTFEIPAEGDHKGELAVTATTYTNGAAGTPATTYYDFITPDELSALLAGKVDKTQKINGHAFSGDVNLTLDDFAEEDNPSLLKWAGDFDTSNVAAKNVSAEDFKYKAYGDKTNVSIGEIYATKTELQEAVADHDEAVDTKLESYYTKTETGNTFVTQSAFGTAMDSMNSQKADKSTTYTKDETDAKFGDIVLEGNSIKAPLGSDDFAFITLNGTLAPEVVIGKDLIVSDNLYANYLYETSYENGAQVQKRIATKEYVDGKVGEHATAVNGALDLKANKADVYTKAEADEAFATPAEVIAEVNKALADVSGEDSITNITTLVNYVNDNAADLTALISEVYGSAEMTGDSRIDTAIADSAQAKSDAAAAVSTANGASTVADEAKTLAGEAKEAATNATTGATASATAAAASAAEALASQNAAADSASAADLSNQAAGTAANRAEAAQEAAESAAQAADGANQGASIAQLAAETAQAAAEAAAETADGANQSAGAAQLAAEEAQGKAEDAQNAAEAAQAAAEAAQAAAEASNTSATAIANEAKGLAEGAVSTANTAKSTADTAKATADAALQSIEVGTGLKVSAKAENKQTVEIDDEVIFVLNCNF